MYAHVKPVEWGDCKAKYADFVGGIPGDVYIGSNVICAGDNTTDACSGKCEVVNSIEKTSVKHHCFTKKI